MSTLNQADAFQPAVLVAKVNEALAAIKNTADQASRAVAGVPTDCPTRMAALEAEVKQLREQIEALALRRR